MQRLSLLLLVVLLSACRNDQKDNDIVCYILTNNIDKATNKISESNATFYSAIKYQLEDPKVKDKTAVLFPLVTKIHAYSDSIVQQILTIKSIIRDEELKGNTIDEAQLQLQNLYDNLVHFQSSIFRIDPELKREFKDSIHLSNISTDTTHQSFKDFDQTFLSARSNQAYTGFLSVLENKIKMFENELIKFYYNKITHHSCERDVPLLLQDKSIVAGEDSVEIKGAIGEVVMQNNTEMTVMGQRISASNMGLMVYKFKANKAKGKHAVPVTIEFTDYNTGTKSGISKTLYYTVR